MARKAVRERGKDIRGLSRGGGMERRARRRRGGTDHGVRGMREVQEMAEEVKLCGKLSRNVSVE